MAIALGRIETDLIRRVHGTGVSREAATVAVVLATRGHARPEPELIDIMAQYPGLELPTSCQAALRELRGLTWVVDDAGVGGGANIVHQAPNLRELIADAIGDEAVKTTLHELRAGLESSITILGPMNDESVYSSYLELLRAAQTDVLLPMLATSPNLSSVPILRERAKAGVKVRALIASPDVVATFRGETMRQVAIERAGEWQRNLAGLPYAEVRVSESVEDMRFASSMVIDRRLVRLDIYDPARQRSLQGVMVELDADGSDSLSNVASHMIEFFDRAWDRARPTTVVGAAAWYWRSGWKYWATILAAAVSLVPVPLKGWFEIFIGVSSTFLATALGDLATARRERKKVRR